MKATELRIGNWYDHNGIPKQATPNTIEEVWESERSWCKPIPLTEEILLKCGFERKMHGRHEKSLRSYRKNGNTFNVSHSGIVYYGLKQKPVLYLHQLQNLYFALTGEELNVEL
jgi:hypothetical protein